MDDKLGQPPKMSIPILVTLLGITMLVRAFAPKKALSSILTRLLGIATEAKFLQFAKAHSPTLFTPSEITTEVREELLKA
jgi:hypothetical protein